MEQNNLGFDAISIMKNTRLNEETYGQAFGRMLGKYDWDWACSLSFNYQYSPAYMKRKFWEWKKLIAQQERMQIAYAVVLCQNPHSHLHALMLGANRYGKTLADVSRIKWQEIWIHGNGNKPLSHAANRIEKVSCAYGFASYMAKNAQANDYDTEISSPRFLKRFQIKPHSCDESVKSKGPRDPFDFI